MNAKAKDAPAAQGSALPTTVGDFPGTGTAVAPIAPSKTDVTTQLTPADLFESDSGKGLENVKREDSAIPFLTVLQALSPQVQEGAPTQVKDARAGMFFETVRAELFSSDKGVLVIPVHFEKKYIEWKPRSAGGGFVAVHNTREEAEAKRKDPSNDIVDTAEHFVFYQAADGQWYPAVLSCKSTQLGFSRKWISLMQSLQLTGKSGVPFIPPTFAAVYRVTTQRQQNDKGSWFGMKVDRAQLVDDFAVYARAKAFQSMLKGGTVKVDYNADPMVHDAAGGPTPQGEDDPAGGPTF